MTARQSFAVLNPISDPHETESLKPFAKTIVMGTDRFGTILTIDQFDDRLTWHVSVSALSDQFKPILWINLKPSQRETVRQLARELLHDVGRPDSDLEEVQDKCYQISRPLTIEEERLVRSSHPS